MKGAGAVKNGVGLALPYHEIWVEDFEFISREGELPAPICVVAHEVISGRTIRLWRDQFQSSPPYRSDADVLIVTYYGSAEVGCRLALGWPVPERMLDLFTEFRNLTNGKSAKPKSGLLDAMAWFRLASMSVGDKDLMRDLILSNQTIDHNRDRILDYCEQDVLATAALLKVMMPTLDVARALLRGRYMASVARMERCGVPIDKPLLGRLETRRHALQDQLIADVDQAFGVYEGRSFKRKRFEDYLRREGIVWPRTEKGQLSLSKGTFKDMAQLHPKLEPLRQLRKTLATLTKNKLAVGADGRNRTMLSPFRSKTGRNQPSNSKFIFGQPAWMRSLIKPEKDRAVAYIDWSQQEFGIAAALSGDEAMTEAYRSGDPYLSFAIQADAAPPEATKASHKDIRDQFKALVLAVQYQMTAEGLARRLGCSVFKAETLLRLHRRTFSTFWAWSDRIENIALVTRSIRTMFGWRLDVGSDVNLRTIRNFPMQATGAEMLRLACCMATEEGINVVAPVHDAVMIEDAAASIDSTVKRMQAIMAEASRIVLGGFELSSDAKVVRWPNRYVDEKGGEMFQRVMRLLTELEARRLEHESVAA
ncbi:MAG: DNA polymerase I [Hyphomonadaceae bacterium]|nr:DNA polymerase I [Hyphomonadaceae bacterium]